MQRFLYRRRVGKLAGSFQPVRMTVNAALCTLVWRIPRTR